MRRRWASGDVTGLLAAPFYVPVPFEWTRYLPGDVERRSGQPGRKTPRCARDALLGGGDAVTTTADLLRRRADDDNAALLIGDGAWTYRELVEEGSRRAALFDELRDDDRPPHIGVLLDNVPDYLFWLTAAALSGGVIVGVNSTYRGDQLGLLDPAHRLPAARHRREVADAPRRRRHRRRRRPRADDRQCGVRRERCVAVHLVPGRGRAGRRPVSAHLHVGFHRPAEGGAVHAGAPRADGHARRDRRGAGSRRRGVRAVAVLPLQCTLHRVVVGPQRRGSDLDAAAVLGVEHAARHPPLRRLDAGVHREGPELHPGHARAARRRRQPAAAGVRERGVDARHHRVRPPLRLQRARQLRLDRGHHHHPPRRVHAAGCAGQGRTDR